MKDRRISGRHALRFGLILLVVLAATLTIGVTVAGAKHNCDDGNGESEDFLATQVTLFNLNGRQNCPSHNDDLGNDFPICGHNPYLWNPLGEHYQRLFNKFCEQYTGEPNETLYHDMWCDETPLFDQGLCPKPVG